MCTHYARLALRTVFNSVNSYAGNFSLEITDAMCLYVQVKTALQDLHIRSVDVDSPVLKTRQRSAFAPNFIHSLDSTHMMLTALASNQAGISFAGRFLPE